MVTLPLQRAVQSCVCTFFYYFWLVSPIKWLFNPEYIINKYGNGRVAPPPEGELADIFCNDSANLKHSLSLNGLTDNLTSHSLLGGHFDATPHQPLYLLSRTHPSAILPPAAPLAHLLLARR